MCSQTFINHNFNFFTLTHNTKFVHAHLKANNFFFIIKRVSDVAKCQLFDIPCADIEQRYKSKT
jgi:hypothetical protein